jgi:methyl-accepting chemotaxis protein
MNTHIASAAEELGATVNEVDRNMTNISDAAHRNDESAGNLATTSTEIQTLSKNMRELVGQFHL